MGSLLSYSALTTRRTRRPFARWLAVVIGLAWLAVTPAAARTPLSVWFMPANRSPDLTELFARADAWSATRSQINVIGFGPGAIQRQGLARLLDVDAFRRIRSWRIGTAIEVPAIKEWDCSGHQALRETLALIRPVLANGGSVDALAMDEPLISAFGMNKPVCRLNLDAAAANVARYANGIARASNEANRVPPEIIDVEAYPSLNVHTIKSWITTLEAHGFKPAAFHLDPNYRFIENHPEIPLAADLVELQRFFRSKQITFGIIVWPGSDPIASDRAYYEQSMKWVRVIHAAIGRPDRVILESWVTRCSHTGQCGGPRRGCGDADPVYCGTDSVPLNFSASPGQPGHLRLLRDVVAVLEQG